jgi:DNA-binding MarR family transcriptional regulator
MGIEKDINQKNFRNDYQKVIINLTYTYNWMHEKVKQVFAREDITSQQYNILRILRGSGTPLSTLQIRQRMLDKMSDTSRIVDRLLLKGLVLKNINETDKRLVDISITPKGLNLLEELEKYDQEMDAIPGKLSMEEIINLNSILDKMRGSDEK